MSGVETTVGPYRLSFGDYMAIEGGARNDGYDIAYMTFVSVSTVAMVFGIGIIAVKLTMRAAGLEMPPEIEPLAAIAGWLVASGLVLYGLPRMYHRHYFKRTVAGANDYVVRIAAEGLAFSLGGISSSMAWRAVDRVATKRGCILLYVDRSAAIAVPRRAFASAAEADAFLAKAEAFWKAGRS